VNGCRDLAGTVEAMTDQPQDPVSTATDRWTKADVTPGEDPREIDEERADPEAVAAAQENRYVRNADQVAEPATEMGTSSTRDIDEDDPLSVDS